MGNHQSRRSLSAGVALISEPNLSAGTRPPNPSILHGSHHRPHSKPAKQFLVRFVLATGSHPMLLRKLCGKWNAKGRSRGLYIYGCSLPMQIHQYFIIIIHQVLIHLIHTSIHPSHHTSHHSHSLGSKYDSRSCLASTANAESNTNPGEDRKDSSH